MLTVGSHLKDSPPAAWRLRMNTKTTKREVRRMIRRQSAWITLNGEITTECTIMDISKRGAKIVPDGLSAIPDCFDLVLGDQKRQACEVVWRRGRMLGIKFVG